MRLEHRLGVRLLNRTTRSVSLTTDGTTFFERCRQILGELGDAEAEVTHEQTNPRGRLRVQMPVGFGCSVLVPVLAKFAELHKEVIVDAEFSSRMVDLAEENIDAVIRIGDVGDNRLVVRKICDVQYITVASPGYLARYGEPKTPHDLRRHCCLGYYVPQTNRYRKWDFVSDSKRHSIPISGNLNMNNGEALLRAALADAGIAMVATYLAVDAVKAGLLRIVLRKYVSLGPPVSVAYLDRHQLSSRIRAFVDFMTMHVPRHLSGALAREGLQVTGTRKNS